MRFPTKQWATKKLVDLLVAPLKKSDVVLGIPFLCQEKVLVDAANHDTGTRIPKKGMGID